ncbi:putative PWWP domain, Chromo-like domain superfamily protein [Plasmopara halstedii]
MVKEMPLDIGLRVDVLDDEGIWNTGMIVDVGKEADEDEDKVEIKYDGWGDEYNQWIGIATQRLAPLHTYTIVKKCWAKLTKWPWWPAFVVLRAPTSAQAAHGLEEETKLYVEFYDSFNEDKRSRCWMQKKNVVAFRDNFDERASRNISKSFAKFVEGTQRAKAGTSPLLFSGPGTLPIEYSSKMAESLEEKKKECTAEQWFHLYKDFSNRYQDLYGYSMAPSHTSPSPDYQSGKKARGRPKKVAKTVQLENENKEKEVTPDKKEVKPEKKEVTPEKKEVTPEKESGDNEDKVVAPERRTTRSAKRDAAPVAVSVRNTRPRRVKVIEVLTDASSSMLSSSLSPSSSRSSHIAQDSNTECLVKSEAIPVPVPLLKTDVTEQYNDECNRSDCKSRRKVPPVKLLERIKNTQLLNTSKVIVDEKDVDFYRYWSGGSRFEVENKPWSILGWITKGFENKLQRK